VSYEIYMAIHLSTGKPYVGLTKKGVLVRWKEHVSDSGPKNKKTKQLVHKFLAKYGVSEFELLTLASFSDLGLARVSEQLFISWYGTLAPGGLNLTAGGEGVFGYRFSEEQRKAQSLRAKQKGWHPPRPTKEQLEERSAKMRGKPGPNKIYVRTEVHLAALRERGKSWKPGTIQIAAVVAANRRRKGEKRKPYPPDHGLHVSRALKGKKHAPEVVAKRAAGIKRAWDRRRGIKPMS
jgi:group I intron endonuclease